MKRAISISLIALLQSVGPAAIANDDPLLRPIAPDYAKRWLAPEKPGRLFGNSYHVGFGGLSVGLIRTSAGLILIDGAVPQAVGDIEANIRALGFSIRDVKLILSTEPHYDHAGGIAALARDSGATVVASAYAAKSLESGVIDAADPQAADLIAIPAIPHIRIARPGVPIRLGEVSVMPVATPGHTMGSMSWRWSSCEERACRNIVFAASLNAISSDGYRFSDPANRAQLKAVRSSIAAMRALPCDMIMTSHPEPELQPKLRGACRGYADMAAGRLNARLRKEAGE